MDWIPRYYYAMKLASRAEKFWIEFRRWLGKIEHMIQWADSEMEMGRRFDVGSDEAMPPSVIWYGHLHRTMALLQYLLCLVCEDMVHIQYFPHRPAYK